MKSDLGTTSKTQKSSKTLRWDKADVNQYYDQTGFSAQMILEEFRPLYNAVSNSLASNNINQICRSNHVSGSTISDDCNFVIVIVSSISRTNQRRKKSIVNKPTETVQFLV